MQRRWQLTMEPKQREQTRRRQRRRQYGRSRQRNCLQRPLPSRRERRQQQRARQTAQQQGTGAARAQGGGGPRRQARRRRRHLLPGRMRAARRVRRQAAPARRRSSGGRGRWAARACCPSAARGAQPRRARRCCRWREPFQPASLWRHVPAGPAGLLLCVACVPRESRRVCALQLPACCSRPLAGAAPSRPLLSLPAGRPLPPSGGAAAARVGLCSWLAAAHRRLPRRNDVGAFCLLPPFAPFQVYFRLHQLIEGHHKLSVSPEEAPPASIQRRGLAWLVAGSRCADRGAGTSWRTVPCLPTGSSLPPPPGLFRSPAQLLRHAHLQQLQQQRAKRFQRWDRAFRVLHEELSAARAAEFVASLQAPQQRPRHAQQQA